MRRNNSNNSEVNKLTNQIWLIADLLRGKIEAEEYFIILFLLSLYKDDLIKDEDYQSIDTLNKYLDGSKNDHEFYFGVHIVFAATALKIGKVLMNELVSNLFNIDKKQLKNNFPEIFDSILFNIAQSQGKKSGNFIQPPELTTFSRSLANIKKNDSVFNPFAGIASFAMDLEPGTKYLGQELNNKTWALGILRLLANKSNAHITYNQSDSFDAWPKEEKFNYIISNPPLGMKLNSRYKTISVKYSSAEEFVIAEGLKILNADGKIISVISNGFLFRGGTEKELRERLIHDDLIETIVSLPAGILYSTGIPVAIIVINKNKKNSGKVKFIDGTNFFKILNKRHRQLDYSELLMEISAGENSPFVEVVSKERIISNDFNLNVSRYFIPKIKGTLLGKIITPFPGIKGKEKLTGEYVKIGHLRNDPFNYILRSKDIDKIELPKSNVQYIDQSCLLLAVFWTSIKPTYFKYEGTPIVIGREIQAFKIEDTKVNLDYLIYELNSEYVKEQIVAYSVGSSIPYIKRSDLLDIQIKLPSIAEQQAKMQGVKELSTQIENIKEERNKLVHGTHTDTFNEFASLKHTLGRPRQNILDWTENLLDYFSSNPEGFNQMDLEFTKIYDAGVVEALKEIKRDTNFITDVLEQGENGLILKDFSSELTSLIEINDIINNLSENGFKFQIKRELLIGTQLKNRGIDCNKTLFKTLFDNLLTNSNKHAFEHKEGGNFVKIKLSEIDDFLILELKDNGKGFPKNYTKEKFITKYSTANPEKGSGLGGYDINRIAAYLGNPNWDLILNEDPIYPVIFRFQFPIKPMK